MVCGRARLHAHAANCAGARRITSESVTRSRAETASSTATSVGAQTHRDHLHGMRDAPRTAALLTHMHPIRGIMTFQGSATHLSRGVRRRAIRSV